MTQDRASLRRRILDEVLALIDAAKPAPVYDDYGDDQSFNNGVDTGQDNMRYSIASAIRQLRDDA